MLALTGCRLSELNGMRISNIQGNIIYWRLGKNQKGWRKEALPDWYLKELQEYINTHRLKRDHLFGPSATSIRRYFNRDIRPYLGEEWQEKISHPGYTIDERYILQLKSFRKSFGTTIFWREYQKWEDAGVALEFTSKRMCHSTTHMTAFHYLRNFETTEVELWDQFLSAKPVILEQRRVTDFYPPTRIRHYA